MSKQSEDFDKVVFILSSCEYYQRPTNMYTENA
jgi:hypothetical protein